MKRLKGCLFSILMLASAAFAESSDKLLKTLQPRGYVNDFAGVISSSQEQQLNAMIGELKQKTGAEIAVVTLTSLEGGEIGDFSNRLFAKWGIGQKGKDNGLLFLAAMQERKMRIEVGYGLEGAIPDATAGRIRRDVIMPRFKAGRPGEGIVAGVAALSAEVAKEYGVTVSGVSSLNSRSSGSSGRKGNPIVSFIVIVCFILFAIRHPFLAMMLLSSGGGGGYRSSGGGFSSGGGGFGGGGFGGGMSGGGGSSGGW